MINIATERLRVFPLNERELEISTHNFDELERTLGLKISGINSSDRQKTVFTLRLSKVKENVKNYMWNTVWLIVLIEENCIVGNIMIKGYPNESGEVIVGYSIEEGYKCKGYMTEAVKALIHWIFQNSDVKAVIADTLKDNIPSHKVLQKIGMVKYKEDEECFWWKIEQ